MIVFAGTVGAGLLTTADPQMALSSVWSGVPSHVVAKTVVSDKVRFAFLAGLEGSGHHYLMSVATTMLAANPSLPRFQKQLGDHLFYLPFAMGESAAHFAATDLQARKEMKGLVQQAADLPGPTVCLPDHASSYPQNPGPGKVMQYTDLRRIAEAADSEGIDLRVVYLKRSARGLISANTNHRHFQE